MRHWVYISLILALFVGLQFFLPLGTAIQIGADEGYELAKATLSIKRFKMYTEVWNDQPPLHTFLITEILKHLSPSVIGPRLLTTFFAGMLLTAVFFISLRLKGLLVAVLATVMLLAAPIFLELGASCMVEIPAMAPALVAIWVLIAGSLGLAKSKDTNSTKDWFVKWRVREMVAGALFGIAFQIKFINLVLLPLVALILWLRWHGTGTPIKSWFTSALAMVVGCSVAFVAINQWVDGQGFLVQFRQSWEAHFASAKSLEYGSPADHPFDWRVLFKNWDVSVPALLGVIVCLRQALKRGMGGIFRRGISAGSNDHLLVLIPVVWLAVNLTVFATHKPWWSCYYLHIAVPLCFCAAIGVEWGWQQVKLWRKSALAVIFGLYVLVAVPWMVERVYLEMTSIRSCPRIYTCLFLEDIERYKPFTKWIYTEEPVYSFHAGIPMPPKFAVVALKRLWSGDMTNEKIHNEMWSIKPGIILLQNENRQMPFNDLIATEYQPVYEDDKHRLYVHKEVIAKQRQSAALQDSQAWPEK